MGTDTLISGMFVPRASDNKLVFYPTPEFMNLGKFKLPKSLKELTENYEEQFAQVRVNCANSMIELSFSSIA